MTTPQQYKLIDKWDLRHLTLARFVSTWSKDPSTQVGAVIANGKSVVSLGFNGFPPAVIDDPLRYQNRDLKYKMIVHAEINAIEHATQDLRGFTLYTWPFMPCPRCAGIVITRGIATVVAPYSDNPRWVEDFRISELMFNEAGVSITHVCEEQTAELAKLTFPSFT